MLVFAEAVLSVLCKEKSVQSFESLILKMIKGKKGEEVTDSE